MDLPDTLHFRETLHGHGRQGMWLYHFVDMEGFGVRLERRRPDRRSPVVEIWRLEALPHREFPDYQELREAAKEITEAEREREAASYPRITTIQSDSCGNRCRLCPKEGSSTGELAWDVRLAKSWCHEHPVILCDTHMIEFGNNPKGLCAALDQEVAARRSRSQMAAE